jgi:hypothetical protein
MRYQSCEGREHELAMKRADSTLRSTSLCRGSPWMVTSLRKTMGTSANRMPRSTGGRIPWIIPTTAFGSLQIHFKKLNRG